MIYSINELNSSCTGGCGSAWPGARPRWLGHVFNCRLSPGWAMVLKMISKFACKPPLYTCHIFNPCWACARGRRTRFLPKCLCARDQRNHTLIQNWFKTGSKSVHHFPPKISNMSKIYFDSCFGLFVVPQNCSQNADATSFQKPKKHGFEPVSACRPSDNHECSESRMHCSKGSCYWHYKVYFARFTPVSIQTPSETV